MRFLLTSISVFYLLFWGLWYVWFGPFLRSRVSLDFVPWRILKRGLWTTGMVIKESDRVRWMRCIPGGRVMLISSKVASGDTYGDLMLLLLAVGRVHQWCAGDPIWLENIAVFLASVGVAVSVGLSIWSRDYIWVLIGIVLVAILHGIFIHWDEDAYWRGIALLSSEVEVPAGLEENLRRLRFYPLFLLRIGWAWLDVLRKLRRLGRR